MFLVKKSTKFGGVMLLTGLAVVAGATTAAILLQKKREEEVYHEAELKAMDELEQMMRAEGDCASCACAEECAAADAAYQDDFDEAVPEDEPAEPAEPAEDADDEQPE